MTDPTTILMTIALWCGSPTNITRGYSVRTYSDVDKCRQQITECLDKSKTKEAQAECFRKQKVGG